MELPNPDFRLPAEEVARLETDAHRLLDAFKKPEMNAPARGWQPERPVVARFSQEDIVGPIWSAALDPITNVVIARTVALRSVRYHLDQEGCVLLDNLAEHWTTRTQLVGLSTLSRMRERVLSWCVTELQSVQSVSSVAFVLADLREGLGNHEVWIQLAGIDIEHRVALGRVELRGVDSHVIDGWMDAARANGVDESIVRGARPIFEKRWKGQSAAVYKGYGDTDAVKEAAVMQAELTCAVLRAAAPQSCSPTGRSFLQPITLESQAHTRAMLIDPSTQNASMPTFSMDGLNGLPDGLAVTRENVSGLWEDGQLGYAHALLSSNAPSAFQEHLVRSVLIYTRHRLSADPIEKVIFTISALEVLLFAGQRGLDQRTTKRRLAGALAGSIKFKEYIDVNVAAAYGLRNGFLHHGHSLADLRSVEHFLRIAWLFFRRVFPQHERWSTPREYCTSLDADYESRFGKDP